jgi:hypothetical protein
MRPSGKETGPWKPDIVNGATRNTKLNILYRYPVAMSAKSYGPLAPQRNRKRRSLNSLLIARVWLFHGA